MFKKTLISGVLLITTFVFSASSSNNSANNVIHDKSCVKIPIDRWVEIDLYWFGRNDMQRSADIFWDRYYPLFENVGNWKGVIINVGWLMDVVYEWQGDLDQRIALPRDMRHWPFVKDMGQLTGSSEQRKKLWKERFKKAGDYEVVQYESWTYGDLKKLSSILKETALKKYNLNDIKIGIFVVGWDSIYDGQKSTFAQRHTNSFCKYHIPNLPAKLEADTREYGAYPNGIPQNTPLTQFFGNQWGDLSKEVGLDAIVLRDSIMGTGIYGRYGPFERVASEDPKQVVEWSEATRDLVKYTKLSNPDALVIGYSNAATAVGDWRVNCFDLEAIAKDGYLDGWIDQTWAGAWNEVGQRPPARADFWNFPVLGWTYQMAYMLVHAAVLAESDVHHYFLTETFDAWESWDVIHTSPDRLRWGIWAYSHAAVKTPSGLKMPVGNYMSWCNQGKQLLSKEDVAFLAKHSDEAVSDALDTKEVFGPTLVYNRSAMEWQNENAPDIQIKEWIDEQAGTLMKWSIPIMSITRMEYIDNIKSDFLIFQTPVHLSDSEKESVINVLKSGRPVAIFASPAGGLDPDIAELIGISTPDEKYHGVLNIGTINERVGGIFEGLPNMFPLYHFNSNNKVIESVDVLFSVNGAGPVLIKNTLDDKQLLFWDPQELGRNVSDSHAGEVLDQQLGSPIPFVLTSRAINQMCKDNNLPCVDLIEPYDPVCIVYWQRKDGTHCVLAGNLEEGINHGPKKDVRITFNFPPKSIFDHSFVANEIWQGAGFVIGDKKLKIVLDQEETKLYTINLAN